MKQNSEELKQQDDDNYIDIAIIIRSLLKNKKFILKIAALFLFVGILIAIFSTNQYTVSSVMLPQSSEKNASGLSGLAAMAGITLGGTTDNIPPQLYSQILNNISFQRELINTPIKFPEASEPISSLEYYTSGEYNKPGVGSYIKKYTIGLPVKIQNYIPSPTEIYFFYQTSDKKINIIIYDKDHSMWKKIDIKESPTAPRQLRNNANAQ